MTIKTIFLFGNSELAMDSLPLKIAPRLRKEFPFISFEIMDPNEEWNVPEDLVVIDTVVGIKEVKIFDDLDEFAGSPQMTMHDFDALANLKYHKKLGKLKKVTIIGVSPELNEKKAIEDVSKRIKSLATNG